MRAKSTDELAGSLSRTSSLTTFLADNKAELLSADFPDLLMHYFQASGLTKASLAKNAGMSEVYMHQLFSGQRRPSRDRLLCIIIALNLDPDASQKLLRSCGYAELYVRIRREAVILFGLMHHMSLFEINDLLFSYGEETLIRQ